MRFAVISFKAPPNSDLGAITLHETEADADECAKSVRGKAYHIHGDGALTYTIASMADALELVYGESL